MNKKIWVMVGLGIVCIAGLIGCNIFSWTHSAGSGEDAIVLVADADSALLSGEYTKAMEYYQKAIDADPANSKARYGYMQAFLRSNGVSTIDMLKNVSGQKAIQMLAPGLVSKAPGDLLINDRTKPFGVDMKKFEGIAIDLVNKLEPITNGQCDGKIPATDPEVNITLAIAYLFRAMFLVLDPPDGNSGSIMYNFKETDNSSKKYILWDYTTNAELPTNSTLPKKSEALNYVVKSFERLEVAILNSLAKDSKGWTDVKKFFTDVKTTITPYN